MSVQCTCGGNHEPWQHPTSDIRTARGKNMEWRLNVGIPIPRPYADYRDRGSWHDDILAIEAEMYDIALSDAREAIEKAHYAGAKYGGVLAAIDKLRK